MSYEGRIQKDVFGDFSVGTLGSTGDVVSIVVERPIRILNFGLLVTTLVAADTGSATIALDTTRAKFDSAARTEKLTVQLVEADAVGTYKMAAADYTGEIDLCLDPGDTIHIEKKVAATDSTSVAGAATPIIYYEPIPGTIPGGN